MSCSYAEDIKFSILVPVYQVEKYIDECIQSVLEQTYSNWELILIDDGSKDKSGEICDRYAEKHPNVCVYHKKNGGPMHTRRYAMARAEGDIFVFLDSDDTLKLNALEVICKTIKRYDCDCVIYGFDRLLNGEIIEQSAYEKAGCVTDKRELYKRCCMGGYGFIWRKAVKRTVFRGIDYSPYYHIQFLEDELQSLEILEGSNKVCFIGDRLYNYRANPNSITGSLKEKDIMDSLQVRKKVWDFFHEQDVFLTEDYFEYGTNFLLWLCGYIVTLCASNETPLEKKRILNEIKKTDIYKKVIPVGIYNKNKLGIKTKVVLILFLNNQYQGLIIASKVYRSLANRVRKNMI